MELISIRKQLDWNKREIRKEKKHKTLKSILKGNTQPQARKVPQTHISRIKEVYFGKHAHMVLTDIPCVSY